MGHASGQERELFDDWPEQYQSWFDTPIGAAVKRHETEVLLEMLAPKRGEAILDVGCGNGIFTRDVLSAGARIVGLDISRPMLNQAVGRVTGSEFRGVLGDMRRLPFKDGAFDKSYSMTAIEFVRDAGAVIAELNRVTRPNGLIVLTTLNSLSPWAERRAEKARQGHTLFKNMYFRSPQELAGLVGDPLEVRTAIHFLKSDDPAAVDRIERRGRELKLDTGAFLAICWRNR